MLKFIIPAILIIILLIFWNKVSEFLVTKFKIKLNILAVAFFSFILVIVLILLYF